MRYIGSPMGLLRIPPLIQTSGFETGDLTEWEGSVVSPEDEVPSVVTDVKHHGAYSCKIVRTMPYGVSKETYLYKTVALHDVLHFLGHFYIVQMTDAEGLASLMTLGSIYFETLGVGLEKDYNKYGDYLWHWVAIHWICGLTLTVTPLPYTLETGRWYSLQIAAYPHETEGWLKIWLDEVLAFEYSGCTAYMDFTELDAGFMFWDITSGISTELRMDCFALSEEYIPRGVF